VGGLASLRNGIKARGKGGILSSNPSDRVNGDLEVLKGKAIGWVNEKVVRR
jgi:hypothetical protein